MFSSKKKLNELKLENSKLFKEIMVLRGNIASLLDNQNSLDKDVQDLKAEVFAPKNLSAAFRGKRANRL